MPIVSVTEIKPGARITRDVTTPLGGKLFAKGKVVLPRDMEILQAFLIQQIEVEGQEGNTKESPAVPDAKKSAKPQHTITEERLKRVLSPLHHEYDRMLNMVRRTFASAGSGPFPILELRGQLEALVAQLKDYHVLTFMPAMPDRREYQHHKAVLCAMTAYKLSQWIGLPQKDWMQAAFAGLLHDIGNTRVDDSILNKPKPLSGDEAEEMRQHTKYGYQLLRSVTAINDGVKLAALQHHEKLDASGYPLRLGGSQIHIYAKIVAVADIFHAMTLERAYRKADSPYRVLEQIQAESFGKLDPAIVRTFIQRSTELYNGTRVRLSDGRQGTIIYIDRNDPTRPMVQVEGGVVNLTGERHLYIEEITG
ncbi:HD-GYP domain-containing protein [Paenibacillus spiritus]|uniref:HD-GYP domain-containing protein n=1 Tax=Paenibacillus spiritus TaxID=2496557 RepID=A0A5J5GAH3_9BACL|nr:HD-GYP domain-containing protein [Paenibacillus spiritus]KAA9005119.1 HD-GYP domain-containing protein [Paenibacillus spiritus]